MVKLQSFINPNQLLLHMFKFKNYRKISLLLVTLYSLVPHSTQSFDSPYAIQNTAVPITALQETIGSKKSIKKNKDWPTDFSRFTCEEIINLIDTPQQVQIYLDTHFTYERSILEDSFCKNHEDGTAKCLGYATAPAVLLSDNGFHAQLLSVKKQGEYEGHTIYPYHTKTGWGALGNTPLLPVYPDIDSLIITLEDKHGLEIDKYRWIDLEKRFPFKRYINGGFVEFSLSFLDRYTDVKRDN